MKTLETLKVICLHIFCVRLLSCYLNCSCLLLPFYLKVRVSTFLSLRNFFLLVCKSELASNILFKLHLNFFDFIYLNDIKYLQEIFWKLFTMWLPLEYLNPFITATFLIYFDNYTLTKSSDLISRIF